MAQKLGCYGGAGAVLQGLWLASAVIGSCSNEGRLTSAAVKPRALVALLVMLFSGGGGSGAEPAAGGAPKVPPTARAYYLESAREWLQRNWRGLRRLLFAREASDGRFVEKEGVVERRAATLSAYPFLWAQITKVELSSDGPYPLHLEPDRFRMTVDSRRFLWTRDPRGQ